MGPAGGGEDFRGFDLQAAQPPGGGFLQLPVRGAGDEGQVLVFDDLVGGEAYPVFRVVQGEEGAQQRLRVVAVAHIGLVPNILRDDQPALLLPELYVGFPGGEAQEGGGVRRPQPILAGLQPFRPVLADDDLRCHGWSASASMRCSNRSSFRISSSVGSPKIRQSWLSIMPTSAISSRMSDTICS